MEATMTDEMRRRIEIVRERNRVAIEDVDRRRAELHDALRRSRAITEQALEVLRRAGLTSR
jgi:hypothetical protein